MNLLFGWSGLDDRFSIIEVPVDRFNGFGNSIFLYVSRFRNDTSFDIPFESFLLQLWPWQSVSHP